MDPTKILVVANAPGILQRVEETLAGLQVEVAIRLRDVSAAVAKHDPSLLVLYLGFERQSTVELVASVTGETGGEPLSRPPAVVCLAPADPRVPLRRRCSSSPSTWCSPTSSAVRASQVNAVGETGPDPGLTPFLAGPKPAAGAAVSPNVHSRAVQKAAELAGGRQALADRLSLPRVDIDARIAGERRPSMAVLLRIVEFILDHAG